MLDLNTVIVIGSLIVWTLVFLAKGESHDQKTKKVAAQKVGATKERTQLKFGTDEAA